MLTSFTHGSLICPSGLPRNHPISPLQDSPALTLLLTHPHTTWAPWIISAMTLMTRSLKDFIYLFLDRGEGREKERERNINVVAASAPPTGDLARNPGMCPDWELNQRHFGLQAGSQSTEPQQPGGPFYSSWKIFCLSMSLKVEDPNSWNNKCGLVTSEDSRTTFPLAHSVSINTNKDWFFGSYITLC